MAPHRVRRGAVRVFRSLGLNLEIAQGQEVDCETIFGEPQHESVVSTWDFEKITSRKTLMLVSRQMGVKTQSHSTLVSAQNTYQA